MKLAAHRLRLVAAGGQDRLEAEFDGGIGAGEDAGDAAVRAIMFRDARLESEIV